MLLVMCSNQKISVHSWLSVHLSPTLSSIPKGKERSPHHPLSHEPGGSALTALANSTRRPLISRKVLVLKASPMQQFVASCLPYVSRLDIREERAERCQI